MPALSRLALRFLIVSIVGLSLAQLFGSTLLHALLPISHYLLRHVQDDFVVYSMEIVSAQGHTVLQMHADLARPTDVNSMMFYPLNWPRIGSTSLEHTPQNYFEVTMNASGVLQYGLVTMIVAAAWPYSSRKVLLRRCFIAFVLAVLLVTLNILITLPAELWTPIHHARVPDITWPLLLISRLLMGGGGLVLGLLAGAAAVYCDRTSTPTHHSLTDTNQLL